MKIDLQKILHMFFTAVGSFAEIRFAKFGQEDGVFCDLSLDVGSPNLFLQIVMC